MSEAEKNILKTFEKVMPTLTDVQKARLLGIGEGLEIKSEQQTQKTA